MKRTVIVTCAICVLSLADVGFAQQTAPRVVPQQPAPRAVPLQTPLISPPQSVLEAPLVDEFAPNVAPQEFFPAPDAPMVNEYEALPLPVLEQPRVEVVVASPGDSRRRVRFDRPVQVDIVLVEPGCGCSYDICVIVPGCCADQSPEVSWRNGILGRKIATLCWRDCNKKIKVVIPRFGKPRVWQ